MRPQATMGVYSYPLFARTSSGKPRDFTIELAAMTSAQRIAWEGTWFFHDRKDEKTAWTLEEFMTPHPDACPKIYGYFDTAQKMRWRDLCKMVLESYPHLEWVQFHFYCSDEHCPFWLEYSKNAHELKLCVAVRDDPAFFKHRKRTWEEYILGRSKEECESLEFDALLYRRNLDRITVTRCLLS